MNTNGTRRQRDVNECILEALDPEISNNRRERIITTLSVAFSRP